MFSNSWFKKEKPLTTMIGMGGGASGLGFAGGSTPFEASGGQQNGIAPGNGYKYHTFYNPGPGTFTVTEGTRECHVMVLGGGGAGGSADSSADGGGGAGGMCYHNSFEIEPGTYAVTIGTGGPTTNASGGHIKEGNPGTNSTFIGPGSSFTMTGQGGKGGYAPNTSPVWGTMTGCGSGNIGNKPSGWAVTAGQPTCPQPGVPAGYVNLGWAGGRCDPAAYFVMDAAPTMGGGGGGCGGAGGGTADSKVRGASNPAMPGSRVARGDLHAQTGGSGWVAPEIFGYAQVFGPVAPHVDGASPQSNQYGGGGSGAIGTLNNGPIDSPYGTQYGSPGIGPPPGSYNPPLSARFPGTQGYGGGGYGIPTSLPGIPSTRPLSVPSGRRNGVDKLGGGGCQGEGGGSYDGMGGSGLVVIAYVDEENGGRAWNATTTTAPVAIWAGGGAGGQGPSVGGGGAYYAADLNLTAGTYTFVVGSSGAPHPSPEDVSNAGYGGAPVHDGNGGGGGGYTAIMRRDFTPTGTPINFKGMGSNTSYSPNGPERNAVTGPNAAPYADLAMIQQHSILVVGGGGGAAESGPTLGGGGGGGYGAGLPAAKVGGTWPFVGGGEGGQLDRGGVGGTGGTGTGRAGIWMCGGWAGNTTDAAASGGGGYFGGGQGCGQTGGSNTELSGGGSGHIDPEYASPGASGENGNHGIASPNAGYGGGQSSPLFPGTAGRGGDGQGNTNVGNGAFVFGPHSGSLAVTPPGGSPAAVPTSGQAFNTDGVYKLVVS